MDISTVDDLRAGFYRLLGILPEDPAGETLDESVHDFADEYLTRGLRMAQRYMIGMGYRGWQKRTAALSWDLDGGLVEHQTPADLPEDFLMAVGNERETCLHTGAGRRWGRESDNRGPMAPRDTYYFLGHDKIILGARSQPPNDLRLHYFYRHPAVADEDWTLVFPVEARSLIAAEAAVSAKEDALVPTGSGVERRIEGAWQRARNESRKVARSSEQQRKLKPPPRYANRW